MPLHRPAKSFTNPNKSFTDRKRSFTNPNQTFTPPIRSFTECIMSFPRRKRSLHDPKRSLHDPKRSLHDPKRSLHDPKRSLHDPKKSLHDRKKSLHDRKRSLHDRKRSFTVSMITSVNIGCSWCDLQKPVWGGIYASQWRIGRAPTLGAGFSREIEGRPGWKKESLAPGHSFSRWTGARLQSGDPAPRVLASFKERPTP
jgi:hypothetical protein